MKRSLLLGLLVCFTYIIGSAQTPLTTAVPATQNFDAIGTTQTATLPANWKADKQTTARKVGTWSAAASATEQLGGNNMLTNASNGIYNFGAGVAAAAPDRAIGFLSSGSGTKSGNLYAYFSNSTAVTMVGVGVSYATEKYRNGSNAAGFSIQLYYSLDGTTFLSAGPNFLTTYTADADVNGAAVTPIAVQSVTNQQLNVVVPAGGALYLCWNYSVASGTTTTSAPALGIDDVSIIGIPDPLPVELTSFTAQAKGGAVELAWKTATEVNNYGFEVERSGTSGVKVWEKIGFVEGAGTSNTPRAYAFTDRAAAGAWSYRLKQIDRDGQYEYSSVVEAFAAARAESFELSQNHPNPFNPATVISYRLPVRSDVSLKIFDMLGKEVAVLADGVQEAGAHQVSFNASALPSGMYFYALRAGSFAETRKMLLVR